MQEVKILVTVDKNGGTKIEAQGFKNNACLRETKDLEEALGKVEKRDLKVEGRIPETRAELTNKVGG
jgi:hypothetical protein